MPLPPLGVDTYRKWAADRWKGVTDATIGRLQSGLWDMQAEDAISRLRPLELPDPEPIYQPPEPAYEPPPPPAPAPQSPLDALGGGIRSTLSGIGGRASTALSGAQDWASRADAAIDDLGGAVAEFGESPSGQYLQEPLKPVRGVLGAMGEAYQRGQAAAPGVLGAGLGALGAFPAGFEQLGKQAALGVGFTPEQAEAQGRLAGIVSPGLGGLEQGSRRLGQLATAGLGAVGAAKGALETEGGLGERAGAALEGGLNWAQFGQPVGAVADLATRLPYRFGQAAAEASDDAALGIRRGQRFRELPLTPEQQAQRARDGAAEQRVFDAIARLWRQGPEGEAAADDLRFLAVGKGEAGEAAARDYLAGKGLEDMLAPAPAAAGDVVGIVPEGVARRLPGEVRLPEDSLFREAVENTPGAEVTGDGLRLDLFRWQKAEQAGSPAGRVFYMARDVEDYADQAAFGGPQRIAGATVLKRPYVVTGETGGEAIGRAADELFGAYGASDMAYPARRIAQTLRGDAEDITRVREWLTQHGGDPANAEAIVRGAVSDASHADHPTRLYNAMMEDAIAAELRRRGHDGMVGIGGRGRFHLTEVMDVRENVFPGPAGEYGLRPEFRPGGVPGAAGLLGAARRATEPLMARGAVTPGERAFDVAAGTAGGVAGAATADEDATWQERLGRGLAGASLGGLAGANLRQLGRVGQRALGDGDVLRVAAGRNGAAPATRQLGLTEAPEAGDLTEEARRVLATPRPTDPVGATNWDRLVAWMTSNALSNPRSLTGNALGGVEQTLGRFGRYTGQGRPQDAWRELGAWWASKGDVAEATRKALWTGERPPRVGETVGATAETSAQAFAGPKGLLATPASRIAGATDAFFSMLSRAGGEAVADARGLTGEARDAFIKEQVQQSVLAGTPSEFTKLVGELKGGINSPDLGDKLKAAAALVYVPFARVPEQIWKQGFLRAASPLTDLPAAGYHALRGNPQKARDAAQRWATNSAIAGPVLWQVGEGNLTGSGPADPNKRRQLEATGWRPNSVRLGDEWYSYDWLGPLGLQINALATAAETWAESGKEPGADDLKRVEKVVNRMGQLAGDEFYLRNFFDLMGAVKDGRMTESLAKTAAEAGARLVPYSAAQNWLAGGLDPLEREPETPLERVQARTLLRQGLPARIDPTTGEPQRRGGTPAERLGGFGRPTVEATPLAAEVARLKLAGQDVSVPAFTPGEKYKDVEQTRAQRRVLQQVYGSEMAAATRELLASPDYQQADDKEKARRLRRQITVARARADAMAGDRVARSPKGKAELAYLAVPHYEGMGRNLSPEAVRLENLRTAEAKQRLAEARKKYPGNPDKGETEFLRADREAYRRAERYRVDAETLAAKKQAIEREYGVDLP